MTPTGGATPQFDPEAVHAKYAAERARRIGVDRTANVDMQGD